MLVYYSLIVKMIPLDDVIRGVTPFLFIFLAFPLLLWFENVEKSYEKILKYTILIGTIFSLYNIYLYISVYINGDFLLRRITLLDPITTVPLPLFTSVILLYLFLDKQKNFWVYGLLLLNSIGFVVTLTRSMMLSFAITLCFMVFYLLIFKKEKINFFMNTFYTSLFIVIFLPLLTRLDILNSVFSMFLNRISNSSLNETNISERYHEYISAVDQITRNPILGSGIGIRFSVAQDGSAVNYIHNFPLYLWVNAGIVGLVLFLVVIFFIVIKLIFAQNLIARAFGFAFFSIQFYSLFFATFKLIHQNIIFALCLSFALHVGRVYSSD